MTGLPGNASVSTAKGAAISPNDPARRGNCRCRRWNGPVREFNGAARADKECGARNNSAVREGKSATRKERSEVHHHECARIQHQPSGCPTARLLVSVHDVPLPIMRRAGLGPFLLELWYRTRRSYLRHMCCAAHTGRSILPPVRHTSRHDVRTRARPRRRTAMGCRCHRTGVPHRTRRRPAVRRARQCGRTGN